MLFQSLILKKVKIMKSKAILYLGVAILFLSFTAYQETKTIIWSGTGDAIQNVVLKKTVNDQKAVSNILYSFKNVRYGSIIDTGSFTLKTQEEISQLLIDLKDAIEKTGAEHKIVWERSKYTLSAGGIAPLKKGHFRIEVGEVFCPIHKKDAKKLIKVLEPEIHIFEK